MVGLQPVILGALVEAFGRERVMVSDLAEAGSERCGVRVLEGLNSGEIFEQCQIILITGSKGNPARAQDGFYVLGTVTTVIETRLH